MKTLANFLKTIAATLVCTICFYANTPTAVAQLSPVMQLSPDWSVEFGAKAFDRPTDDLGLPLVTNTVTNDVLLTSDQATDLNGGAGAEVKFNWKGNRYGTNWEIRSFLANFDETNSVTGANMFSPLFPTITPDNIFTNYDSRIFSIELNAKRTVRPGVTVLAGPRYVSFSEEYTSSFDQLISGFTLIGSQTNETRNSLYGYQLGMEFNVPINQTFYAHGYGKFAGFVNPSRYTTFTSNNFSGSSTPTELTKSSGAFMGEVGGRIYAEIVPNSLHSYIGYEATWIDGVALAPAQFLTVTTTPTIQTSNTPFFHSINFGFKYSY